MGWRRAAWWSLWRRNFFYKNFFQNILKHLQQWAGGDEPDEVCEEARQEVVPQPRVHDYQQLGELSAKKCHKKLGFFLCHSLSLLTVKLNQVWGPRQNLELRTKLIQPMEPDAFNMYLHSCPDDKGSWKFSFCNLLMFRGFYFWEKRKWASVSHCTASHQAGQGRSESRSSWSQKESGKGVFSNFFYTI